MNKLCRIFSRFSVEICLTFHGLDHCTVTIWLLLLFLSKLITCNGDYNIIIIVCYYIIIWLLYVALIILARRL